MLNFFHRKTSHLSMPRSCSCIDMASTSSSVPASTIDDLAVDKKSLRRCATSRHLNTSGWGIVPVLNELERRGSTNNLRLRRSPSASQHPCANCRRLFFCSDDGHDAHTRGDNGERFCSLDCKSSFTYSHAMQELVDWQLQESPATASSDDEVVTTLDDDADFSL